MKKLIFLFAFLPFFVFSQEEVKNQIYWIPLEKAKELATKNNRKILIFFHKEYCPYCDDMQNLTFRDPNVIKMINDNFLAVKIDSRTKDTIIYNGKAYGNQQPASSGRHDWRHDFFYEVARFQQEGKDMLTTPTLVLFNPSFEKISNIPGYYPKETLLNKLQNIIK